MIYNRETHRELSHELNNVINESGKVWVLPQLIQNMAVVTIYLIDKKSCIVESQHAPIRHGRHCGSRVHLGEYGKIDYNPQFIWNGKEWLLNTWGTFLFAEVELNVEPKECPCSSN